MAPVSDKSDLFESLRREQDAWAEQVAPTATPAFAAASGGAAHSAKLGSRSGRAWLPRERRGGRGCGRRRRWRFGRDLPSL